MFSPGFFEGIVGGQVLWRVHSSPLGKEVTQERNLRARKKKKKNDKEEKEEEIRRIKKRERKAAERGKKKQTKM